MNAKRLMGQNKPPKKNLNINIKVLKGPNKSKWLFFYHRIMLLIHFNFNLRAFTPHVHLSVAAPTSPASGETDPNITCIWRG